MHFCNFNPHSNFRSTRSTCSIGKKIVIPCRAQQLLTAAWIFGPQILSYHSPPLYKLQSLLLRSSRDQCPSTLWTVSDHPTGTAVIASALLSSFPLSPPQPVLPPKLKEWVSHNVGQLKVPFSSLPPALSFLHNGPLPSSLAHLTHQANRLVIPEHIKLIPPLGLCADTSLARNILLPVFPWLAPLVTQLKCFLLREAFSTTLVGACQPLQYIIPVVISALH